MNYQDELWADLDVFTRYVAPLEEALGYVFKDKALLREALTSDRYWNETVVHADKAVSHRSLALIGDVVLQHLSLAWGYTKTKDRHNLLRIKCATGETQRLAQIAEHFTLEQYGINPGFIQSGSGSAYKNRSEFLATLFEAVVGAWSVDDPSLTTLEQFLAAHLFCSQWIEEDLQKYGLASEEMERLHAGYPSLWVKHLTKVVFGHLGATFRGKPLFRVLEKRFRSDGLPEFHIGLVLGDHVIVSEWGRGRNLTKRYALFRCALKLLNGDEWIYDHIASCEGCITGLHLETNKKEDNDEVAYEFAVQSL